MKRIFAFLCCVIMIFCLFTACGTAQEKNEKIQIVATVFPQYDWIRTILGDTGKAELTLLLDDGVDLHSYQPTADDLVKIAQCDLFVYVGGESDAWAEDALRQAGNPNRVTLNLLETLGENVKIEEAVEGMQVEEEEEEEEEYDEHVWLSLRNAVLFCNTICDALMKLDAENAAVYRANTDAYTQKLHALDAEYSAAVEAAGTKTLLFADRFPFRYMVEDYGLSYYAAFIGCSAESEASFETVAFLADKVSSLHLPAVLTLEGSSRKIAETVLSTAGTANTKILSLDSMQSVTLADAENGAGYLAIMEENLSVLREALA